MPKKWRFAYVGLSALLLVTITGPANAWEFELAGSFNWSHEWYNQQGSSGFFGPYNVDNGTTNGRLANLNFWNGGQFDTNFVTGSNAGWSYFNVEFEPEIRINPAIKIRGLYRLGSWGDPATSDYTTQDAPGTGNAFSEGMWSQFWVTANSPWGVFGVGKRPWSFANGLQYDGADAATTESLTLVAPYGPLDIGIAYYPFRYAGDSSIWVISGRNSTSQAYGDPYDLPVYAYTIGTVTDAVKGQYYSRADRSGGFSKDFLGWVTYSNGPMKTGVLAAVGSYHIGPEAVLNNLAREFDNTNGNRTFALDSEMNHGTIYFQYNNGRFFFNSEAAWLYWRDKYQGISPDFVAQPTNGVNLPYTRYVEQWRWMAEAGVLAGPAKVTALAAWTPGPDRRNGLYIDRQPAAFVWHPTFDSHFGNFSVFSPYSYIFAYDYGSGLNAYNLSGDGFVRDAFVLAGRLDYAVAANLNLFGSFFWAKRTSDGYPWGAIRPTLDANNLTDGSIDWSLVSPGALNYLAPNGLQPNQIPNITERALGYEINVGVDWKLLEGWNFTTLVGYWAPGKWFNYACIDRSVVGWDNGAGVRSGRSIDPVLGGNFSMTFEF